MESNLGAVIKAARISNGMTQEKLAEKTGVGLRHMMAIENEGKCPSYDVLYKLIRGLNIPADIIFYPEKHHTDSTREYLTHLLGQCDDREIGGIIALVESLVSKKDG